MTRSVNDIKVSITLSEDYEDEGSKLHFFRGPLGKAVKRWYTSIDIPCNDMDVITAKIDGKDIIGDVYPTGTDFGTVMEYVTAFARGVMAAQGKELMYWDKKGDLKFNF